MNTFMLSFDCAQDFRLMRDLQKRKHILFQLGCLIKIQIGKQPKTSLHGQIISFILHNRQIQFDCKKIVKT